MTNYEQKLPDWNDVLELNEQSLSMNGIMRIYELDYLILQQNIAMLEEIEKIKDNIQNGKSNMSQNDFNTMINQLYTDLAKNDLDSSVGQLIRLLDQFGINQLLMEHASKDEQNSKHTKKIANCFTPFNIPFEIESVSGQMTIQVDQDQKNIAAEILRNEMCRNKPFCLPNKQKYMQIDQLKAPDQYYNLLQLEIQTQQRINEKFGTISDQLRYKKELKYIVQDIHDIKKDIQLLQNWVIYLHAQNALAKDEANILKDYYTISKKNNQQRMYNQEMRKQLDKALLKLFELLLTLSQQEQDAIVFKSDSNRLFLSRPVYRIQHRMEPSYVAMAAGAVLFNQAMRDYKIVEEKQEVVNTQMDQLDIFGQSDDEEDDNNNVVEKKPPENFAIENLENMHSDTYELSKLMIPQMHQCLHRINDQKIEETAPVDIQMKVYSCGHVAHIFPGNTQHIQLEECPLHHHNGKISKTIQPEQIRNGLGIEK